VSVRVCVCVVVPNVAFTVSVYFPACVPVGFGFVVEVVEPPPPPHAHITITTNGAQRKRGRAECFAAANWNRTRHPRMASAHIQGARPKGLNHPWEFAVVVTLTLKEDAEAPLTETVEGTEQVAPVGEPLQVKEAVPLRPPPPMESEYVAVLPALTVVELEAPEATPRPRLGFVPVPVPESATVCGLFGALSVKVMLPDAAPAVVGEKVTLTVQDPPAAIEVPQVLDSLKGPLA
jgi:hypothetical protein